jgi:hypothetical protein
LNKKYKWLLNQKKLKSNPYFFGFCENESFGIQLSIFVSPKGCQDRVNQESFVLLSKASHGIIGCSIIVKSKSD